MKLIMSEQEYREAIEKAREEGREAGYTEANDGWNDVFIFCSKCANRMTENCPLFHVLKTEESDFCSWAVRKEQTDE